MSAINNMNIDLGDVVANFQFGTSNRKIGWNAIQAFFIPKAMVKHGGFDTKHDSTVCFDCPMSGSNGGGCYTHKGLARHGLNAKVGAMARKGIKYVTENELLKHIGGYVRFGAYGEPILLPLRLVKRIVAKCTTWTGYTHQWMHYPEYSDYFMASVETVTEAMLAESLGWRWFLVIDKKNMNLPDGFTLEGNALKHDGVTIAINCPASKEAGRKAKCNTCGLCRGKAIKARNIWTFKH